MNNNELHTLFEEELEGIKKHIDRSIQKIRRERNFEGDSNGTRLAIGEKIKKHREEKGLHLDWLSSKTNISITKLVKIEKVDFDFPMSDGELVDIAKALCINVYFIDDNGKYRNHEYITIDPLTELENNNIVNAINYKDDT